MIYEIKTCKSLKNSDKKKTKGYLRGKTQTEDQFEGQISKYEEFPEIKFGNINNWKVNQNIFFFFQKKRMCFS